MNDVVPGPSAAVYDVWSRLAWLLAVVVLIIAAALQSLALAIVGLLAVAGALFLALRSSRVTRLERDLGYSTVFDFPGFASRDARTKQLLRAAGVAPESPGRRSIFRSMLSVKPGTVLARRLEEDEKQ